MLRRSFTSTSEPSRESVDRADRRHRSQVPRWFVPFVGIALALFGMVSPARGTPEYPGVIDGLLGTSCPDPLSRCLICHTTALGGRTATQPFVMSLREQGLERGREPEALRAAFLALPDETDSDLDGTPDKEELASCLNPSGEEFGVAPEYGCDGGTLVSTRVPVGSSGFTWILASLMALGAIHARSRCDLRRR